MKRESDDIKPHEKELPGQRWSVATKGVAAVPPQRGTAGSGWSCPSPSRLR